MFSNENQLLYEKFRIRIEKKFGESFTISNRTMKEFVLELIQNKIFQEDEIMKCLLFCYRDNIIEYDDLIILFKYLGYNLPYVFSGYAQKAKLLLREVASKVGSEVELLNRLVFMYQYEEIKFELLEISCYLMGYTIDNEYKSLPDAQRRNTAWVYDKNNLVVELNEVGANLLKCCKGLEKFNMEDFFVPSFSYTTSWDFIEDYMMQKNISNSVLTKHGLNRKKKYKLNKDGIKTKIDAYRLIFILNMNVTEAQLFLTFCGFCFSPLDKTDLFFLNYLNGRYRKVKTLIELTELSREYCYENFEYPDWL